MTRPHHDFGIEAHRYQDRRVVGPCEVLHIVIVSDETSEDLPIFDWGRFIGAYLIISPPPYSISPFPFIPPASYFPRFTHQSLPHAQAAPSPSDKRK